MEDKWLFESGKWLNDRIISGWQFLLQQKYPCVGGLYPTVAVAKRRFKRDMQKHEVVQIINVGNSHWVGLSTIGCSVGVVHSLDSIHCRPSSHQEVIIADLLQCPKDSIKIEVLNVQRQSGGECGVFALANITATLEGLDPSVLCFNQKLMRPHIVACLQQKDPKPFPLDLTKKQTRPLKVLNAYTLEIYCVCRLPDDGSLMVMCSICHKWFHQNCTTVRGKSERELKKINWECVDCNSLSCS